MGKIVFKIFEKDSLADAATYEDEWVADDNYIIKYILVKRKDNKPFTASTISLFIEEQALTKDKVPCNILGSDIMNAYPINEPLDKDKKIHFSIKNNEGETISVFVVLCLERR